MSVSLDTINSMDAGSADPIGTLQEVRGLGLPPVKYGSCSKPGPNNRGCSHFDSETHGPCPVLQLCRAKGRKGYENVAFIRMLAPTVMKQDACKCHQYMDTLAHADPRSGVNHIIGLGGDSVIKRRVTVLDQKNPNAPAKTMLVVEKVPALPRPGESMSDRLANLTLAREMTVKARQTMTETMSAAALAHAENMAADEEQIESPEDFEVAGAETPATDIDLDEETPLGEDDILNDDPEPEVIQQVSGKKRGRPRG